MLKIVLYLIVISFTILNVLEFISFFARISGKINGWPTSGYAYQNIILTVSRLAFFFMMPMLGYVIDQKVSLDSYLIVCVIALFLSAIFSYIALIFKRRFINLISAKMVSKPKDIIVPQSVFKFNFFTFLSMLINFCYSSSFFITYLLALIYHENRSMITNFAAAINGLATVSSSFYIEPKISKKMDNGTNEELIELIDNYLISRIFAVGVIGPIFILLIYLEIKL